MAMDVEFTATLQSVLNDLDPLSLKKLKRHGSEGLSEVEPVQDVGTSLHHSEAAGDVINPLDRLYGASLFNNNRTMLPFYTGEGESEDCAEESSWEDIVREIEDKISKTPASIAQTLPN